MVTNDNAFTTAVEFILGWIIYRHSGVNVFTAFITGLELPRDESTFMFLLGNLSADELQLMSRWNLCWSTQHNGCLWP